MIEIYREYEEPLILEFESLKNICLREISFHRCFLKNLNFEKSKLLSIDFRNANINNVIFKDTFFICLK